MRWYLSLLCFLVILRNVKSNKPHIVLIIADDMGWNDVGFHGNNAVKTPNIDSLAYNGIILNRHYVLPSCTPSRTALLTGKYPIRTGLQGYPISAAAPRALPLNHVLLPEYLQRIGYRTHLVGKWHLGFYKTKYTPNKRGFDSFFGYYNGWINYNNATCELKPYSGYDARRNLKPAKDEFVGKYVTDVLTDEAIKIVHNHDTETPLFLILSHAAVHADNRNHVQVKDERSVNETFIHIKDNRRRSYVSALNTLDKSVGMIVSALNEKNLLDNCIILFMTDNGGATMDTVWHFSNYASNWPLRGMKMSASEGGIRGTAVIWSSKFNAPRVSDQFVHMTDWLPTFYAAAGGTENLDGLDGINQWSFLIDNNNTLLSAREELLVNIDEVSGESAYIFKNWKLIQNKPGKLFSNTDLYGGAIEWDGEYNMDNVVSSQTDYILRQFHQQRRNKTIDQLKRAYLEMRSKAKVSCRPDDARNIEQCFQNECLFDITNDPCETTNRAAAAESAELVNNLRNKIDLFRPYIVKQEQPYLDEKADPKLWNDYWSPWLQDDH